MSEKKADRKPRKKERANLRLTEEQFNRIQGLANIYAGGNMNLWITWGALNAPRAFITKADLERRKPMRRRPR